MKRPFFTEFTVILLTVQTLGLSWASAFGRTAVEHLTDSTPPVFREGHTLIPLSRWGWTLSSEATVELCEKWGYALEFGLYATMSAAENAHDPKTRQGKVCELTASDPKKYPLFVITHRPLGSMEEKGELPESYWLHDADENRLEGPSWKRKNPEAPDSIFQEAAKQAVEPLKKIREVCPIAIILDGGENGLTELGHSRPYLQKDPSVVKAKGGLPWYDYYSRHKARTISPTSRRFVRRCRTGQYMYGIISAACRTGLRQNGHGTTSTCGR